MGYFCKIQAKKYSFRRGGLKIVRGAIEILKGGPYQFLAAWGVRGLRPNKKGGHMEKLKQGSFLEVNR